MHGFDIIVRMEDVRSKVAINELFSIDFGAEVRVRIKTQDGARNCGN